MREEWVRWNESGGCVYLHTSVPDHQGSGSEHILYTPVLAPGPSSV